MIAHAQTLRVDPLFDPEYRQILDFSASERVNASLATMRALARMVPFAKRARRVAVVRNDVFCWLFRIYAIFRDSSQSRLIAVRTLDRAFAELDVPRGAWADVTGPPDRVFDGGRPD